MCCSIQLTLLDKTISFKKVLDKYCLLFNIPPSFNFFMPCLAGFQFYILSLPQTINICKRRDRCVDLISPNLLIRTLSHTKIPHFPLFKFLKKSFPYSYLKMHFMLLIFLPLLWVWFLAQTTFSCNLHKMSTLEG